MVIKKKQQQLLIEALKFYRNKGKLNEEKRMDLRKLEQAFRTVHSE